MSFIGYWLKTVSELMIGIPSLMACDADYQVAVGMFHQCLFGRRQLWVIFDKPNERLRVNQVSHYW
jgi:hypothetical protein